MSSLVTVISVAAVSGAAYTTFNAAADGSGKDVCKNSAINCNIYGDKNLSDDYDAYTNRTTTVKDGEVFTYTGTHDMKK